MASFEEWLDENEDRAYPILESSSRESVDGAGTLPNSLVVDARISAPAGYFGGSFFVSSAEMLADSVVLEISYHESPSPPVRVSSVRIEASSHSDHAAYPFVGSGPHRSVTGALVVGNLGRALSESVGSFRFSPEATPFELSVVHISQPAVDHLEIVQSGRTVARLTGAVRLASGANVRLTRQNDGSIRIDAISGENLSDCPDPGALPPPVRTVNGVPPDENGDLWLSGSECISISRSGQSSLVARDLCSTSCCGCQELETLLSALRSVEAQSSELRNIVYQSFSEQSARLSSLAAFVSR